MNERSTDTNTEKHEEKIHPRRQVGDSKGMRGHGFMWRRRFSWRGHYRALCSGNEHGNEKWLTESLGVR